VLSFHSTKPLELFRENDENLGNKTELPASIILIFFSFFCVATSNPFLRTSIPCISSLAELNPILQDPVLAIHPPCIYAGYVASAIVFCICMSSFYKNPGTK
jgi:cytochrome c biogenesis factor